ncbi:MAG: hypothetical protein OXH47_08935 [Paracoccaceae bacterium]|nr:hypothetical protein [Paracoccaceae bacterium]
MLEPSRPTPHCSRNSSNDIQQPWCASTMPRQAAPQSVDSSCIINGVRCGRLQNFELPVVFGELESKVAWCIILAQNQTERTTRPMIAINKSMNVLLKIRSCEADTFNGSSMASDCAL